MNKRGSIDLARLAVYILKHIWLVIICAAIGFGGMYYMASRDPSTYTATGTMFVTNSNPNLVNYGYTNTNDIYSAVSLVSIYTEVIKGESVMQRVLECPVETMEEDGATKDLMLSQKYQGITSDYIRSSFKMESINETPVVRVSCTTTDPQLSADICNSVLQVAPTALTEVVGAGDAKPQDYADVPYFANSRDDKKQGLIGGLAGAIIACAALFVLFMMNRKVERPGELISNYTPPILSYIQWDKNDSEDPRAFLLNENSDMDLVENYAKLRMNLLYALSQKKSHTFMVTSCISGEGKSTISSNLAVSYAYCGKKVLLIDADMRRACQNDIFHLDPEAKGLSDVLAGNECIKDAILSSGISNLAILPAGTLPPNPSELLQSQAMQRLLEKLNDEYDLILIDVPPINIVSDPLALSPMTAGAVFVVRQKYSDHREIRRALIAAEMTGLEVLGFVFYGEVLHQGKYYGRRAYKGYQYYNSYDSRRTEDGKRTSAHKPKQHSWKKRKGGSS